MLFSASLLQSSDIPALFEHHSGFWKKNVMKRMKKRKDFNDSNFVRIR